MHDTFEFREDFARSQGAAGSPVMLCPVKWEAAKVAMAALRCLTDHPSSDAFRTASRRAVAVLDQVGLTTDFKPSKVS